MTITIEPLIQTAAPIILIYGASGIGKSTLALSAPTPIYIPVGAEAPPRNLQPLAVKGIEDFSDIMAALRMIYQNPSNYQTLVLDSLTAIEPLVWRETCARNKWRDIEAPGYGKGYLAADDVWREIIKACHAIRAKHKILVITLCHSEVSRMEEPGLPPFNKFGLRMQHRAENLWTQSVDATLFMYNKATIKVVEGGFNKKTSHAESGGLRWLAADGRAHFTAKNRLGMPAEFMLDMDNAFAALLPYTELPVELETKAPGALAAPAAAHQPTAQTPSGAPPLTIPEDPPFVSSTLPATTEETSKHVLAGDNLPY